MAVAGSSLSAAASDIMLMNKTNIPDDPKFWFDHKFRQLKAMHRTVNFVNGARGCGKTYAFKQDAVRSYLKDGSQFVYMRRYEKTLSDAKATKLFFPLALKEEFHEHELTYRNGCYMIDGKVAGFPFALNTPEGGKSTEYDNVKSVCFDEYIDLKGRYLPDEVKLFNEATITIGRYRDPQFWLIANNLSWNNPYFIRYRITHPDAGKETRLGKTWSLTLPDSSKYKKFMETTPIGSFLKECDPEHFEYAFGNELLEDNFDFIEKHPGNAKYSFTMKIDGAAFGVWIDNLYFYISKAVDPSTFFVLDLSTENVKRNKIQFIKGGLFSRFLNNFIVDNVRYESIDIKARVLDIMRYII